MPVSPPSPPIMSAEEVAQKIWSTEGGLYETNVHGVVRCNCDDDGGDVPSLNQPKYRLLYIPCRNRGEIIRLILEEARVPYEVEVVGWINWTTGDTGDGSHAVKATTPQGKCPVLRHTLDDDDGGSGGILNLGQEGSITRYLASELNLAGRTPAERAEVDSLYCLWFATMRNHGVSHDGEFFSIAALNEAAKAREGDKEVRRPRYEDVQRLQALNDYSRAERSLMILDFFERTLERNVVENGNGCWLVGEGCTYVDLGLYYILFELAEDDNVPDFDERFGLPFLGQFVKAMGERPHIRDYVCSPRRMPRYNRAMDGKSLYRYVEGKGSPRIV